MDNISLAVGNLQHIGVGESVILSENTGEQSGLHGRTSDVSSSPSSRKLKYSDELSCPFLLKVT